MVDSAKECTWLLSSSWSMKGKNAARWRPLWYRCRGGLLEVATTTAPLPQRPANSCRIIMASAISVTCGTRWYVSYVEYYLILLNRYVVRAFFTRTVPLSAKFVELKISHLLFYPHHSSISKNFDSILIPRISWSSKRVSLL